MAQIAVDSGVMRDKQKTLDVQAKVIKDLYSEMQREMNGVASRMRGTTVDTAVSRFNSMQSKFETVSADIKAYGTFLGNAADAYDKAETEGTRKAQEQGKIF